MTAEQAPKPAADETMKKPPHRIEAISLEWPPGLRSLEDAARGIGISPDRLAGLASGGFAPHLRIDGGQPFFKISELRTWAAANMIERIEGRDLPKPVRVIVAAPEVADFRKVPVNLREIAGLCDITDEVMRTGIYFLCRDGSLLYIGQSVNAASRIGEHFRRYEFDTALFLPWPSDDLSRIEAALIRALRPPLNGKHASGTPRTSFGNRDHDDPLIAALTNPPTQQNKGALNEARDTP